MYLFYWKTFPLKEQEGQEGILHLFFTNPSFLPILYKKGSLMVTHPSFGKMICYSAILLLSLFFEPNLGQDETASTFEGLASLISNIVSLDNSDLVFISDFHNSQQVI